MLYAKSTLSTLRIINGSTNILRSWKHNRSTQALANFIIKQKGIDVIQQRVSEVIHRPILIENVVSEHEVRFDQYRKGRMHDLAIFGRTNTQSVFIGVEAKVNEPFGQSLLQRLREAKATSPRSKVPERVNQLLKLHSLKLDSSTEKIRYQLLYSTAGTLIVEADIHVLYIMVFKTPLYSSVQGKSNHKNYLFFMKKLNARSLVLTGKAHEVIIGGKPLFCLYEYF